MTFRLFKSVFIFSTIILFASCVGDDSGQVINTIPSTFEIISESEDHTILEQALVDTGLDQVLNSGIYTIFAPDDEAFGNIDISTLSNDEIRNILLHHVINGNGTSTDFGNGYIRTNATESYSGDDNFIDMHVSVDGGITLNGIATVTQEDISAINGTVHIVDEVITLANIVTLVSADSNFSNLAAALTQEQLLGTLSTDFGTNPAPFTVFAPNNTAFENFLAEDNGFETVQDILDLDILADVLTYHVLPGNAVRESEITDGLAPTTVQGETFTLNTADEVGITDQNGRFTTISATDITTSNGVIHVIDNILLPTLP